MPSATARIATDRLSESAYRIRRSFVAARPALLSYVLVRTVGVAWLAYRTHGFGARLHRVLTRAFDATYYRDIALYGYGANPRVGCSAHSLQCKYAFFPLYPGLIHIANAVLPGPADLLAWAIAVVGALIAAWGVHAVVQLVASEKAAIYAVVLWGIVPHAMVETMAYSEPVFTAFAAWALHAMLRQRWRTAVGLTILAGLTRPVSIAVVLAAEVALGVALWSACTKPDPRGRARLVLCMLLAPLGWLGWIAWVGYRTGAWNGYQRVQAAWHANLDFGHFTLHQILAVFDTSKVTLDSVEAMATVIAAVVLLVLSFQQHERLPLLAYALGMVVLAVGSAGYFNSKSRYLLPAFSLLIPLARALARVRVQSVLTVLGAATLLSALYGGYLLTTFHASP